MPTDSIGEQARDRPDGRRGGVGGTPGDEVRRRQRQHGPPSDRRLATCTAVASGDGLVRSKDRRPDLRHLEMATASVCVFPSGDDATWRHSYTS